MPFPILAYTFAMSAKKPDWLPEIRDFCRRSSISISGWGADTLVVEAQSPERISEASSLLRQFGFVPMPSDDDKEAGLLLLSRNPAAVLAKPSSFDISRLPLIERIPPVLEAAFSVWLFWHAKAQPSPTSWHYVVFGAIALCVTLWDFSRTWGWKLELSPEGLRLQRYFQWSTLPWSRIRNVDVAPVRSRGGNREAVKLTLADDCTIRVGVFGFAFARAVRDRLRRELAQRQPSSGR